MQINTADILQIMGVFILLATVYYVDTFKTSFNFSAPAWSSGVTYVFILGGILIFAPIKKINYSRFKAAQ